MIKLWNIKAITHDLRWGNITPRQGFIYFFLTFVLIGKVTLLFAYLSYYSVRHALIDFAIGTLIAGIGLIYTFRQNASGDNKDYFLRFFCLGLPVMLRLLLAIALIFVTEVGVLLLIQLRQSGNPDLHTWIERWINPILGHGMDMLYYYLLGRAIRNVASDYTPHL